MYTPNPQKPTINTASHVIFDSVVHNGLLRCINKHRARRNYTFWQKWQCQAIFLVVSNGLYLLVLGCHPLIRIW